MVNLTHEDTLLQEIKNLFKNKKTEDSIALTTQAIGSGLKAEEAVIKIQKLIPTIRQRLSAAKFYLDAMENMNYDLYLGGQSPSLEEQESLIDFSDSNLRVQIDLFNPEPFPLIVFLMLQGFFSNLVSLEDCVAKIINIAYDLIPSDERPSDIGKALNDKLPTALLTTHLRTFRAIGQDGKPDDTGSTFNIAREIRHKLVHDEIAEIVLFPSLTLVGFSSDINLYFNDSFFPSGTASKHRDTEMVVFCQNAYESTINFVDECYKLIRDDLQQSDVLPVQ